MEKEILKNLLEEYSKQSGLMSSIDIHDNGHDNSGDWSDSHNDSHDNSPNG